MLLKIKKMGTFFHITNKINDKKIHNLFRYYMVIFKKDIF